MSATSKQCLAIGGAASSIIKHGSIFIDTRRRIWHASSTSIASDAPPKKTAPAFNLGLIAVDEHATPSAILSIPGSAPVASDVPQTRERVARGKRASKKPSKKSQQELPPPMLLSVSQGAQILGKTSGAVRHMIFNAEAYRTKPELCAHRGFLECIVRPPGERRVFLHRDKLLALIDSWARNGDNKEGEK